MGKELIKDILVEASIEEGLPIIIREMFQGTTLEILGGLIGMASSRIGVAMLAYQQKRASRNWKEFLKELAKQQDIINQRLDKLEESKLEEFKTVYFPAVIDYVPKIKQVEKIKYLVNGLKNLPEQGEFKEDFVLLYYDVLEGLNVLDIKVLRLAKVPNPYCSFDVMREYHIDSEQLRYIVDKLYRCGLFRDKSAEIINTNFQKLSGHLKKESDEIKTRDVNDTGTHELSEFGENFIKFFEIQFSDSETKKYRKSSPHQGCFSYTQNHEKEGEVIATET